MARSPNYPAIGLRAAVELANKLWTGNKRSRIPLETAVTLLGFRGYSGPTRTRVSALRKYGLLEQTGDDIQLTELAARILAPIKAEERELAIKEAASSIELFRELRSEHPDASNETLTSILIRQGFSDSGAKQAIGAYRDTVAFARLDSSADAADGDAGKRRRVDDAGAEDEGDENQGARRKRVGMTTLSFQISHRQVEVAVPGGPLTKGEIGLLKEYLAIQQRIAPDGNNATPEDVVELPDE